MRLDDLAKTIKTADNGQERINVSPQTVYHKVGDATNVDDCGDDKDAGVNVNVTNNVGSEQIDTKTRLLQVIMTLLSLL